MNNANNTKKDFWSFFEKSGKIQDYLAYKGYYGCDFDRTDNNQRNSDKGASIG